MIDLEKRITGDWIDIREAAGDQYRLNDLLKISPARLRELSTSLKLDNEEGILEYKGSVLRPVFVSLEEMKYYTLSLEELASHKNPLEELLFVILLQRLICTGAIPLRRAPGSETVPPEQLEIKQIIWDIKNRIRANPDFQKHPAVKNIIMQIGIYQKEKEKMRELLPTIKEEKQATFRENFKSTFDRIFSSIRRNYATILGEEEARRQARQSAGDLLRQLEIGRLTPLLQEQAREISRIRSTLSYTAVDKYRTRESLLRLFNEKDHFLTLIDREEGVYRKLCSDFTSSADRCIRRVSNRFRDELIRALDRLSSLEEGY